MIVLPSSSRPPQTTHRPGQSGRQSGAIGSASQIASRTGVSSSSSWWSFRRSDVGLVLGRRPACPWPGRGTAGTPREVETSIGTRHRGRQRLHSGREPFAGRRRPGSRGSSGAAGPVRRWAGPARGPRPQAAQVDVDAGDGVGALGTGLIGQQAGDVPGERPVGRPRSSQPPRRLAARSASSSIAVARRRPSASALGLGRELGPALVEQRDALLDALERLDDVALEPDQDADRVLVGATADLVGVLVGVADDPPALRPRPTASARARR